MLIDIIRVIKNVFIVNIILISGKKNLIIVDIMIKVKEVNNLLDNWNWIFIRFFLSLFFIFVLICFNIFLYIFFLRDVFIFLRVFFIRMFFNCFIVNIEKYL